MEVSLPTISHQKTARSLVTQVIRRSNKYLLDWANNKLIDLPKEDLIGIYMAAEKLASDTSGIDAFMSLIIAGAASAVLQMKYGWATPQEETTVQE